MPTPGAAAGATVVPAVVPSAGDAGVAVHVAASHDAITAPAAVAASCRGGERDPHDHPHAKDDRRQDQDADHGIIHSQVVPS
ncbi:MAG: hypothetical protein M3063_16315 [Actinomycetota bacterium]|nr:hypothetical protein [Actinomycetota bacterium]MDQ6947564.1 hypothetical protein [Actinomycetota bacterium]